MRVLTLSNLIKMPVLGLLLLALALPLTAAFIQPNEAAQAAQTWLRYNLEPGSGIAPVEQISRFSGENFVPCAADYDRAAGDLPRIYLVKYTDGRYVLLSADDNSLPVLAYSTEPRGAIRSYSPELIAWVQNYERQINAILQSRTELPQYRQQWSELLRGNVSADGRTDRSIQPLLALTWDQGWPYNELCPADEAGPGGHVYAGCVATAMAMVMKYWNHPATGVGNNSYYAFGYGYQSANFGATTYQWDLMPNSIATSNLPVATLLYHCGVAVDMDYAPDGSGAQSYDAAAAFVNNFRYPNAVIYDKSSYSDATWNTMLQAQIDNGSPMYYSGSGSGGGHAFVIDGYDTASYFHFNFGWSGSGNGYFYVSNINPGGSDFNSWNSAIMNSIPQNYSIANTRIKLRSDAGSVGNPINLTVSTNPVLGSWNVNHYEFDLLYDHQFLSFNGADIANTLAAGGTVAVNETEPGLLHVVWNSTGKIIGAGDLVRLSFTPSDAGEFLFDIGGMMFNSNPVTNIQYLMATVTAPVATLAESHISLQNVMHLGYQQIGTTEVRTTYLLPSWDVAHYQFNLGYDPSKLEFVGIDAAGTLSEGLEPVANVVTPGTVAFSCDASPEFAGSGALIKVQFRAIGNGPSLVVTQVTPSNFYFNNTLISSVGSANFILSPSSDAEDDVAAVLPVLSISPNPVRENVRFCFSTKGVAETKLSVYNVRGQLVRELTLDRGQADLTWDSRDTYGKALASGIYFINWKQDKHQGTGKILILRQ